MRMRHAAVVAGLALGLMSGAAKAAYIIDINQIDANVVATGSGSIDLSGLNQLSSSSRDQSFIYAQNAAVFVGGLSQARSPDDSYSGLSGPSSFGDNGSAVNGSVATGSIVGVFGALGYLFVPRGYVSGDLGSSTAVFSNTTLVALGLTPGSSFSFYNPGQGAESFPDITINVGVSPVPLPASAPMFGAALLALGAVGYGVKRKKAAANA